MSADTAEVVYLETCQFAWGGLFDSEPADYLIHLVRGTRQGTPGDTLCGIDRFAKDAPGWSMGGGVDGPGMVHTPCQGCVDAARSDFAGLPVAGMRALSEPIAAAIGTAAYGHSWDVLRAAAEGSGPRG
jgi:hypothetical protein